MVLKKDFVCTLPREESIPHKKHPTLSVVTLRSTSSLCMKECFTKKEDDNEGARAD